MPKKPKYKKKNAANLDINRDKLENTLKKQWVEKAIEKMKQNYSNAFIREWIRENKEGSKADTAIDTIISEANAYISRSQLNKAEQIIPLHRVRYDKMIEKGFAVQDADDLPEEECATMLIEEPKKYWMLRERKIRAFNDSINVMIQKEELLQYHSKDFNIQINTEEEVIIKEVKPKYDLDLLSFEEQLELYQFFTRAKKNENDLLAIIQGEQAKEAEKVMEAEVVSVEVVNVDQIKQEQLPVPPVKSSITSIDPTIKLRESLQKIAAKQFKEAGGKLTEEEEKLIK